MIYCYILIRVITSIKSKNLENTIQNQMAEMRTERMIVSIESIHYVSFDPSTEVRILKLLMNKSFL
jgi:hypothetical protein